MLEIFIQSFVLYFVVIDPLGNTPIFMTVTQQQNIKEKNKFDIFVNGDARGYALKLKSEFVKNKTIYRFLMSINSENPSNHP